MGKLLYLNYTWPDITFAVGVLSQYMHDPQKTHLQAAYCVLAHLKSTVGRGLVFYQAGNLAVDVYTDADFARSLLD